MIVIFLLTTLYQFNSPLRKDEHISFIQHVKDLRNEDNKSKNINGCIQCRIMYSAFEKCMNEFVLGLWYRHMEFISTQYFGQCDKLLF